MIDEGYVKFHASWEHGPAPANIGALVAARNELFALGLIGVYPDSGIGYGNVSVRVPGGFIISGSATGSIPEAKSEHFCLVDRVDVAGNEVHCIGPVTASSESMTHAMLYASGGWIGAVLHVHHLGFWRHLLAHAPASAEGVSYGTPAMALEMARLMKESALPTRKILAMTGHEEGVVAIGADLEEAMQKILVEYQEYGGKIEGGSSKTRKE